MSEKFGLHVWTIILRGFRAKIVADSAEKAIEEARRMAKNQFEDSNIELVTVQCGENVDGVVL